jgi:hypothetical protein
VLGVGGLTFSVAVLIRERVPQDATAAPARPVAASTGFATAHPLEARPVVPTPRVPSAAELRRARRVGQFAERYTVAPELAEAIHDAAIAEGLEPEVAFRLVRRRASSSRARPARSGRSGSRS